MNEIDKIRDLLDTLAQLQIASLALVVVLAIVLAVFYFVVKPALERRRSRDSDQPPPPTADEITGRFATALAAGEARDEVRDLREALGVRGGKTRIEELLEELVAESRAQGATLQRIEKSQNEETTLLVRVVDGQLDLKNQIRVMGTSPAE